MIDTDAIKSRFERLAPCLDERGRRLLAANEALAAGRGGIAAASRATGVARSTIGRGLAELRRGNSLEAGRKDVAGHSSEGRTRPDVQRRTLAGNKPVAVVARNTQARAPHKQGQVLHTPGPEPHKQGRMPLLRQPRRRRLRR